MLVTSLIVLETGQSRMVQAALSDWKPVLTDYNSSLTLQTSYTTKDSLSTKGINQTATVQAFRQSIKLNALGYVYHPDLILFRMQGKYGEDQNQTDVDGVSSTGRGGFDAYELESVMFRAKPYTIQLFSRKDKPFTSYSSGQSGEIKEESGADFKYLKNGYRAGLKYNNNTSTDTNRSNSIDDYESYYALSKPKLGKLNNFTFNAIARYQEDGTTSSAGDGGSTVVNQGTLSNGFDYSICNFITSLTGSTTELNGLGGNSYLSDAFGFSEGVRISLPWDFNSSIAYGKSVGNSTNKWRQRSGNQSSAQSGKSDSDADHLEFTLSQSLYDSLDTNFTAKHDSTTSNRVDQGPGATGNSIADNPVAGLDEVNEYGMVTQYRKILPRNSTLTASLSSNTNQTKQVGLSSEARLYTGIQENVGTIQLSPMTDTNQQISVEVLLNNSDECKTSTALNNLQAPNRNFCWGPLTVAADNYVLVPARLLIEIRDLSRVPFPRIDPNQPKTYYDLFKEMGGFTFRVISFRKAGDFTVQTNQLAAGLALFQFISSGYQHSVTNQNGTYGGQQLVNQVVSDTVALGFSLYDWTFNASQDWTSATDESNNTVNGSVTNFSATYAKSRKFWKLLTVSLGAKAEKGWANSALTSAKNSESTTEGYTYSLSGDMPLPYIKASLKADQSYSYSKGTIIRYESYSKNYPLIPTRDTGINQQTSFNNSISLSKPFTIPWINFAGSSYVRYRWENQTIIDNAGISNGGQDRSYLTYGVNAGRGWYFGSTSVNLNANYAITKDAYDETGTSITGATMWQTVEQTNSTSVFLTVTRQLF